LLENQGFVRRLNNVAGKPVGATLALVPKAKKQKLSALASSGDHRL